MIDNFNKSMRELLGNYWVRVIQNEKEYVELTPGKVASVLASRVARHRLPPALEHVRLGLRQVVDARASGVVKVALSTRDGKGRSRGFHKRRCGGGYRGLGEDSEGRPGGFGGPGRDCVPEAVEVGGRRGGSSGGAGGFQDVNAGDAEALCAYVCLAQRRGRKGVIGFVIFFLPVGMILILFLFCIVFRTYYYNTVAVDWLYLKKRCHATSILQ